MFQNAKVVSSGVVPVGYHEQKAPRGSTAFAMSSSQLKEFARCPERWFNGYESPDSESKRFGSLLDCLLLTPEQLEARFSVQPETYDAKKGGFKPWNNNANVCKVWRKLQGDREIITGNELKEAKNAALRMLLDPTIKAFLEASEKQVWIQAEWHDEKTNLIVPVRCLIDLVPKLETEFSKCAGDLKTTRSGAIIPFQRHCFQMGYHIQGGFNMDMLLAARPDEDRTDWCLLLQENFPPWQPAKRLLSQDFIALGRAEYKRQMGNYCLCLKHSFWPGYDDSDESVQGWSVVNAEPWMETQSMFSPKPLLPETELTADDGEIVP